MIHPVILLAFPPALCTAGPTDRPSALDVPRSASAAAAPARQADSLQRVYDGGQTWERFYEAANARRALWVENWTNASVPDALAARARAAGSWRILVITEPRCSDSVNSVPYIAKLIELTPGLEMRLVSSRVGRPWMEAHRSPDGRASTPTVLVLDEEYRIRGCWIEQPAALQAFWLPVVARGTMAEEVGEKMAWYARDEGRETLREIVEVLEGARTGQVVCPGLK